MLPSAPPRKGFWVDYSRAALNRHQYLETEYKSQILIAFIAVCLTLAGPYIFVICRSFGSWLLGRCLKRRTTNEDTEETPLLRNPHDSSISAGSNRDLAAGSNRDLAAGSNRDLAAGSNRDLAAGSNRDLAVIYWDTWKSQEHRWPRVVFMVIVLTIVFGVFVAWTVATIFSAKIASDRAALSDSDHCGIWVFDRENAGEESGELEYLQRREDESRAAQYVRDCYGSSADTGSSYAQGCSFFYNQSISYNIARKQKCPFPSSELCRDGLYSAISFDTGLVDASVIGINVPVTSKFRRRTTCSPLNISEKYIQQVDSQEEKYLYLYGVTEDANYTLSTAGHPFQWKAAGYSVQAQFASMYPDLDYWRPIPGLRQPKGSTVTIIFVTSLHLYHLEPSNDPIFPARESRQVPGYSQKYYYNSDPRAQPLACVDRTEVCAPDSNTCWSMVDDVSGVSNNPSYWLMKWSLESSNTYDSIVQRLGNGLLAQGMISSFFSDRLSDHHWEREVEQLFATSLARIQFDAWKIATGQGRERAGYIDFTPDIARGQLCGLYKFKTIDHTNVNVLGFFGLIFLAMLLWLLSWNAETLCLAANDKNSLVVEVLARRSSRSFFFIVGLVRKAVRWPFSKVSELISRQSA